MELMISSRENANLNQIYDLKYIRKIIKTIKNSYPALVRLLNSDENKEENTELAKDFFQFTNQR